ncbi:MAG: hypothetical protein MRY49_03315 [Candidatus Pacebacteria bacterium]|nr:hypothetical protein [Candidatus Paceibacterota bacterium]
MYNDETKSEETVNYINTDEIRKHLGEIPKKTLIFFLQGRDVLKYLPKDYNKEDLIELAIHHSLSHPIIEYFKAVNAYGENHKHEFYYYLKDKKTGEVERVSAIRAQRELDNLETLGGALFYELLVEGEVMTPDFNIIAEPKENHY